MTILNKVLSSPLFPNRDAIAGGLAGLAAFFVAKFLKLDMETATALVGAVTVLVNHFTPLSVRDLAKEADTVIKDKGGNITDLLWKFDGGAKRDAVPPK